MSELEFYIMDSAGFKSLAVEMLSFFWTKVKKHILLGGNLSVITVFLETFPCAVLLE